VLEQFGDQLIAVVVALVGLGGAAFVGRSTNRKLDREGADAISRAAVQLVDPLEQRLDRSDSENEGLRMRITALEAEARDLETFRFENQHLRERVKYLEMQVDLLRERADYREELERAMASAKEEIVLLRDQIRSLGHDPVTEQGTD